MRLTQHQLASCILLFETHLLTTNMTRGMTPLGALAVFPRFPWLTSKCHRGKVFLCIKSGYSEGQLEKSMLRSRAHLAGQQRRSPMTSPRLIQFPVFFLFFLCANIQIRVFRMKKKDSINSSCSRAHVLCRVSVGRSDRFLFNHNHHLNFNHRAPSRGARRVAWFLLETWFKR